MSSSPSTLLGWRSLPSVEAIRTAWDQFEPFLAQHGYRLFVCDGDDDYGYLVPQADCSEVRCEDEYGRFLPEIMQMEPELSYFRPQTGIHVAARSPSNKDVVVRIMAIGDEGQEHLAIMRALAAPEAQHPHNRTVPMIDELTTGDVVLGIFPIMHAEGMEQPWFETVAQVFDALEQVLECLVFLHERLIAHRDFGVSEVFTNYGRDWRPDKRQRRCVRIPPPFRSHCPDVRYFLNDFELSTQFARDSDPATRLVSGLPTARYGGTAANYYKSLPPEALLAAPYCPFKADMYQLGNSALEFVLENIHDPPGLKALFAALGHDDPAARPTAAEALATLRDVRRTASQDALNAVPVHPQGRYKPFAPGEICSCSGCKAARLQTGSPAPGPNSTSSLPPKSLVTPQG